MNNQDNILPQDCLSYSICSGENNLDENQHRKFKEQSHLWSKCLRNSKRTPINTSINLNRTGIKSWSMSKSILRKTRTTQDMKILFNKRCFNYSTAYGNHGQDSSNTSTYRHQMTQLFHSWVCTEKTLYSTAEMLAFACASLLCPRNPPDDE